MSIVNWGNLPKTTNDNETIAEAIASALAIHNADDSAHGQSNEAIYNHRIGEILDHLENSVLPEHISNDISTIRYIPKTNDQNITSDTVWANITGLLFTFNSSKEGTLELLLFLTALLQSWDTTILVRVKVTVGGVTTYYPSSTGIELVGAYRSASSHFEQMLFPFVVPLISGNHTVQVQCINSDNTYTVQVKGYVASYRSFITIKTVGSVITPL